MMKIKPDGLAVVADKAHQMYNRVGWLDECFPNVETGDVVCHWVDLQGSEYELPEYGQLMPYEDAIRGRIGNLITGGNFHLAIGKTIYESCLEGRISVRVRPELRNLDPQQLKVLAEQMYLTFSVY